MSKDTILMITPSATPNIGGVETHIDSLISEVNKKYSIVIITNKPIYSAIKKTESQQRNIKYIRISPLFYVTLTKRCSSNIIKNIMYWYSIIYLTLFTIYYMINNSSRIRFIHAHEHFGAIIAYVVSKIFKKRVIVTIHTYCGVSERHYFASIIKKCLSSAEISFVSSEKVYDELKYFKIKTIKRYEQWVDIKKFHPVKTNKSSYIDVLIIGRFSSEKGFDSILQKMINRQGIRITIIGQGNLNLKSLKSIKSQKNNTNLRIIGPVNNDGLNYYYNSSDYTIIPDIMSGNIPRTVMESLAAGTPLCYTNNGLEKYLWFKKLKEKSVIKNIAELKKKNLKDIKRCQTVAENLFSKKNMRTLNKYYS